MAGIEAISRRSAALLAGVSAFVAGRKHNKLWSSALLGVLIVLIRYWTSKPSESPLISDPSKIARRVKGSDEYEENEYDVIVVGGGTAGCVIASRLSEDPSIRILLLEAGASLSDDPATQIPAASGTLHRSEHGYSLFTEKQKNAGDRARYWPRAKLLGGCSNSNAMVYQCGHPTDYDEWASIQKGHEGASSWTYKEFNKYFRKFEKYNPSKLFPNVNSSLRNFNGVVNVGYFGYFSNTAATFIQACIAAGIPQNHDFNTAAGTMGVSKVLTYIDSKSNRVTMERAYLTPTVLARPNLKVATRAGATKILFEEEPIPRAVGVEFADVQGTRFRVLARKEVVLTAGAIHTPHILMLSGIGPADHLNSHHIQVTADLPGVGSYLKDHPVIDLFYMDKSKTSLMFLKPKKLSHKLALHKATLQYLFLGKGPLMTNVAEALAFVRSSDPKLFPPSEYPPETAPEDNSSGKGAPDLELFASPMAYLDHGGVDFPEPGDHFALHATLLRPQSKGKITLKSADPLDAPGIDPNYFAEPNDVTTLIRGAHLCARIAHTEPLKSQVDPAGDSRPTLDHNLDKRSDAEIAEDIRRRAETLYHPCCTARMAPLEDGGVVDPFLRVYKVKNLRIADASVFPEIVSGHTVAPVLAIAEKAADLIKDAVRGQ